MGKAPQSQETHAPDATGVYHRLLDAAEQVASRDGVANLTLEAVARQAGVSKGGLLYHFPSKSALITGIIERLACRCDQDQNDSLKTCGGAPNEPGTFTRAYLLTRNKPLDVEKSPIQTALLAAAASNPQYMEPMRQRLAQWQARIENDGIDPATATIVRLAIDGLCLGEILGIPVPTNELRAKVIEQLLAMTCAREPAISLSKKQK